MKITKEQASATLVQNLPNDIKMLSNFFTSEGYKLYLVGGCIRDTFLGKTPKDYDVCTNAMPDTVISILENYSIEYNLQGEHFAVVVAKMEEGDYEIATFRKDIKVEGDNRNPKVQLGVTIEEDCRRRDFTCNALFMDLQERQIIDLVGGVQDIHNKIIRSVGNPDERFDEDHLRKPRLVVRAVSDGFSIDERTFNSVMHNPTLNIKPERIYAELRKAIDKCKSIYHPFHLLHSMKLLGEIFKGFKLNDSIPSFDKLRLPSLNILVASVISPENENISRRLVEICFPVKTANSVEFLITPGKHLENPVAFLNKRKSTDLTDDEILLFFNYSDRIEYLVKFRLQEGLAEDFMARGFQGKELGEKLNEFYLEQFKEAIN